MQDKGFFALYRGLAPTLIASFPKAGIRFGSNAHFKNMLKDENGKLTPGKHLGHTHLGEASLLTGYTDNVAMQNV